jgi:hypothetical protein
MKSAFSPAALPLWREHAGSACASELDDEQFDETGEDMASKLEALKAEFLAKLAILDAKYEAKFSAIDIRLANIEARLTRLEARFRWAFGLMLALHLVEIGILTKLGFS